MNDFKILIILVIIGLINFGLSWIDGDEKNRTKTRFFSLFFMVATVAIVAFIMQ